MVIVHEPKIGVCFTYQMMGKHTHVKMHYITSVYELYLQNQLLPLLLLHKSHLELHPQMHQTGNEKEHEGMLLLAVSDSTVLQNYKSTVYTLFIKSFNLCVHYSIRILDHVVGILYVTKISPVYIYAKYHYVYTCILPVCHEYKAERFYIYTITFTIAWDLQLYL